MMVRGFFQAAVPLFLLISSIILMLFTALSGVSHNELWLVKVDLTKLSVDSSHVSNGTTVPRATKSNLTATDLGLSDIYEINVWGYCYRDKKDERHCVKGQYDWASSWLPVDSSGQFRSPSGSRVTLPPKVSDSLSLFQNITKGAQVALIVCLLVQGVMFAVGLFSHISGSASTWLSIMACIGVILACAAAGLVSAMSAIVMDAIENSASAYGVVGSNGTTFLAIAWIGVVLVIGAAVFWLVINCCCKSRHRMQRNTHNHMTDAHKAV